MASTFQTTASGNVKPGNFVDVSELDVFTKSLARVHKLLGPAFLNVRPEFGAYMAYSGYLEHGTSKMNARPHIEPAVFKNSIVILRHIGTEATQLYMMILNANNAISAGKMEKLYAKSWLQVLNGPVARDAKMWARGMEVFDTGSHIRSIHGYAYERTPDEVKALQQSLQRKARERLRKLKHKRKRKRK